MPFLYNNDQGNFQDPYSFLLFLPRFFFGGEVSSNLIDFFLFLFTQGFQVTHHQPR